MAKDQGRVRYEYPCSVDSGKLRILTLEPADDPNSIIQCKLEPVSRSNKPTYTALSYCWGDPESDPPCIEIEGKSFEVRQNLLLALKHLRERSSEPQRLWIDAVCIVQDDYHEFNPDDKNGQVLNMHKTYKEASAVIVWLGKEEDESGLAIAAVNQLGEQLKDLVPLDIPGSTLVLERVHGREPKEYAAAVGKLLQRPYFSRVWVIQELCLAPSSVTMVCGKDEVPFWKLLYLQLHSDMIQLLLESAPERPPVEWQTAYIRASEPPIGLTRQFFIALRGQQDFESMSEHEQSQVSEGQRKVFQTKDMLDIRKRRCTLLMHLWSYRGRECGLAHDRVYGLLGIACDGSKEKIKVDYQRHPVATFTEATRAIIEASEKLAILGMCLGPDETAPSREPTGKDQTAKPNEAEPQMTKPSWVHNFHDHSPLRPLHPLTLFHFSDQSFTATGKSVAGAEFSKKSSELVVQGYQLGTIIDSAMEGVQKLSDVFPKAEALVTSLTYSNMNKYPNGVRDAFWRTLIANRDAELNTPTLAREGAQFLLWADMHRRGAQQTVEVYNKMEDFQKAFNQNYMFRDFFVTDTGYMGLCGIARKIGDIVCLLAGSQTPFVLREVDQRYRLVGESYVHGAMHGAVWAELERTSRREKFRIF